MKNAEEQARNYAREMTSFLQESNRELRSSHQPRTKPENLEGMFHQLYMRHLREHFLIVP